MSNLSLRMFNHKSTVYFTLSILIIGVFFFGYRLITSENALLFSTNIKLSDTIFFLSLTLLAFKLAFLIFLFVSYRKYKPIESVSPEELLFCTIIVPAYNEGQQVYETLKSLSKSDYPKKKMHIIAIDDGSADDTWFWLTKAKQELGNSIDILQQPTNKGKREALYLAFKKINSEVIITVDSDSVVAEDTIRNIVSPFVLNQNCGAVAGNVKVLNVNNGIIPKMLNVSFAFSFEFVRSAQSIYGTVLCTPGALSAYRKEAVLSCLDKWIGQTFLGKRTQIGEDRAMTNMILKQGYDVFFQSNAMVYTDIPTTYNQLRKMFTRWERSNIRENLMMTKFAFSNYRTSNKLAARFLLINQWIKMLIAVPAQLVMLVFLYFDPFLFITTSLFGIFIFSSIPAYFFYFKVRSFKDCMFAYSYGIFYAFSLFWITPYALLTAGNNGWLTRSKVTD
ncbi:MAG: glycosyltransferase [Schleiferiaceae bacterium]|nr:glycosyltransferase [Schleiferiaceae bacterium]